MMPDIVDLDHVAIRVRDLDAALWFYHELLGMPIRDRDRFRAGEVPYVAVVAGGRHIHLVPTEEDIDVGGDHVCLLLRSESMEVKDKLMTILETLEEHGNDIEPDEPKRRYGAYGRSWAAYVRDPDDRRVELKIH